MKFAVVVFSCISANSLLKFDLDERSRIMKQSMSLRRWDNFYEMFMSKYDFVSTIFEIFANYLYKLSK